jgi:putative addiction module CopG family antidote
MSEKQRTNPSFSLNEREMGFISRMTAKKHGRFGNKTEVVRAGLRLLEDYENNMAVQRLRADVEMAEASIADNQGIAYENGSALADDIIKRGERKLNREH